MTTIRETARADCPFSAAIEFASTFFQAHGTLAVSGSLVVRTDVLTTFEVVLDRTDSSRLHDAVHLDWSPGERLPFPRFSGLLTVRPHDAGSDLTLEGSYEPPFGLLGTLFDTLLGEQIAHGTVRALLRQIVLSLEASWRTYSLAAPDIATLNAR